MNPVTLPTAPSGHAGVVGQIDDLAHRRMPSRWASSP
jgi:hypothetical protein